MTPKLKHLTLSRPLAALDLESTGVDPGRDRIVEVAVLKFVPHAKPESYRRLVNPGVPIPAAAARVHGITDAEVAGAPRFRKIAPELFEFLRRCDFAGFGVASFDLPLLAAEFARAGLRFRVAGRAVLDAL